jgi:hypothetical protein
MTEPSIVELIGACVALVIIAVFAWRASSWLSRRGHVVRPATMMDYHMTRIERQTADNRRERGTSSADDGDLPKI